MALQKSSICCRRATLGMRSLEASLAFVRGLVRWSTSHRSMAVRSYVWPSVVTTGSSIISEVMAQMNAEGTEAFWYEGEGGTRS